jgi:PST family polysaccharide transporter
LSIHAADLEQTPGAAASRSEAPLVTNAAPGNSYREIVRSTAITGGSQTICTLIGMLRNKIIAVLLGPGGVGEVAALMSAVDFVGKASGLGIGSSAVREISEAHGTGKLARFSQSVTVLRRVCWATGLLGWVLVVVLAEPLSQWTFGSSEYRWAIAILGATVLLGQLMAGQAAVIRGTRRIGLLARQSVLAAILTTLSSAAIYAFWGRRGIVAVLLTTAAITLFLSWYFARQVPFEKTPVTWRGTLQESRRLIGLGLAFSLSSIVTLGVAWAIQSMITRGFGTEGNGQYSAALSLSLQFAGFVLAAMGADFYPRLAASSGDHAKMNRLVNEQTQIGMLIALPGLLAMLATAPWIVWVFYSARFQAAADLMPWLLLGMYGRVISWPMSYLTIALGRGKTYLATEGITGAIQLLLAATLLEIWGVMGVAISFAAIYGLYTLGLTWVSHRTTRFFWQAETRRIVLAGCLVLAMGVACNRLCPPLVAALSIGICAIGAGVFCVRGVAVRVGEDHRLTRLARRIPFLLAGSAALTKSRDD